MEKKSNIIYVYSRKMAVADGVQVLADPETTKEAGIKFPVYLTEGVFNQCVKVPKSAKGKQTESGRLWDILSMFRHSAVGNPSSFLSFEVKVSGRRVQLESTIGPLDFDDPAPAITIFLPGED